MAEPPILEVRGLTVAVGDVQVLSGVDWTVRRGEHWVLFGANGSGKTTLLSALLTYVPAMRGRISVLGRTHGQSDWRELRKLVGIVSTGVERRIPGHETGLNVVHSGKDQLLGSWGPRHPAMIDRARQMLDDVHCGYVADRRFDVMSHGERQRVLIARALMGSPPLLILDEPCSGLDAASRERFLSVIDRMADSPAAPTLVFVTHHVEEISSAFENVLLLQRGRVLAAGAKHSVLTSALVSRALGAPMVVREHLGRYSLSLSEASGRVV
jgi:iron complex transport system ATP-binding protein